MITRDVAQHNLQMLAQYKFADLNVGAEGRLKFGLGAAEQVIQEIATQTWQFAASVDDSNPIYFPFDDERQIKFVNAGYLLGKVHNVALEALGLSSPMASKELKLTHEINVVLTRLSQGEPIFKDPLGCALEIAAMRGHREVVRFLLSEGENAMCLYEVIQRTAWSSPRPWSGGRGHAEFVSSVRREISEFLAPTIGKVLQSAVCGGQLEIVRFLLSEGRTISIKRRGVCVIHAASQSRADIVEVLLANGPIFRLSRDSARLRASGENRAKILGLLDSAADVCDPKIPCRS